MTAVRNQRGCPQFLRTVTVAECAGQHRRAVAGDGCAVCMTCSKGVEAEATMASEAKAGVVDAVPATAERFTVGKSDTVELTTEQSERSAESGAAVHEELAALDTQGPGGRAGVPTVVVGLPECLQPTNEIEALCIEAEGQRVRAECAEYQRDEARADRDDLSRKLTARDVELAELGKELRGLRERAEAAGKELDGFMQMSWGLTRQISQIGTVLGAGEAVEESAMDAATRVVMDRDEAVKRANAAESELAKVRDALGAEEGQTTVDAAKVAMAYGQDNADMLFDARQAIGATDKESTVEAAKRVLSELSEKSRALEAHIRELSTVRAVLAEIRDAVGADSNARAVELVRQMAGAGARVRIAELEESRRDAMAEAIDAHAELAKLRVASAEELASVKVERDNALKEQCDYYAKSLAEISEALGAGESRSAIIDAAKRVATELADARAELEARRVAHAELQEAHTRLQETVRDATLPQVYQTNPDEEHAAELANVQWWLDASRLAYADLAKRVDRVKAILDQQTGRPKWGIVKAARRVAARAAIATAGTDLVASLPKHSAEAVEHLVAARDNERSGRAYVGYWCSTRARDAVLREVERLDKLQLAVRMGTAGKPKAKRPAKAKLAGKAGGA